MDRHDEQSGQMQEIYQHLHSAYCQFPFNSHELCKAVHTHHHADQDGTPNPGPDPEAIKPGLIHPALVRFPLSGIKEVISWLYLSLFREVSQPSK